MLEIIFTPWRRMKCKDKSLSDLERFSSGGSNNEYFLALKPSCAMVGALVS